MQTPPAPNGWMESEDAISLVEKKIGAMDLILDASGIAELEFNLLDALALNGVLAQAHLRRAPRLTHLCLPKMTQSVCS